MAVPLLGTVLAVGGSWVAVLPRRRRSPAGGPVGTPAMHDCAVLTVTGELAGLGGAVRLTATTERRLDFTIGTGGCDHDPTGLVYETGDTVVIGGHAVPGTGTCDGSLTYHPVSVTLTAPLGTRPVVDAVSGRPLIIS